MAISLEQREEIIKFINYYSKRCPHCESTQFTSDNHGNHRCLDCGEDFTDETALPSRAGVENQT